MAEERKRSFQCSVRSVQSDLLHAPRPVEGEAYSTGPCSSPTCISWLASNLSPRCSGWRYEPEGLLITP